ncbi:MAG: hypothetical protein J6T51_06760, partial [Kiritimatiellae bacterium]|nr:hypothetical protein [Kiritimatiellia bacterium]
MRVRVAIDLALDRLFDYEVPAALERKLAVGQLLSVPFGHREARGFAMSLSPAGEGAERFRLKPITAIVDETPFFSPALLELVRKVAAYTAAPLESVLRAALPAAVLRRNARAKEQLFVEPVPGDSGKSGDSGNSGTPLTPRQRWLRENVERLDGGWMRSLCAELKTTPASLRALAERGLVRIEPRAR